MAKGTNQKGKLLYLLKIFSEDTDENHGLTVPEIVRRLDAYGVAADRKTLYADMQELRQFGVEILAERRGKQSYYAMGGRLFELAELKLLVDSVQGAKFITQQKSAALIKKLEGLVSRHQATQLQRQVYTTGRIKTINESIYYNVDAIHTAIHENHQITFQYFQWNEKKEMVLRHDGAVYQVSPWRLIWDDEYYYLVGYDANAQRIKHYRVDKMLRISAVPDSVREGREIYEVSSTPNYSTSHFSMYSGAPVAVTLLAENQLAGVIIDRFGKEVMLIPEGTDHFRVTVNVFDSELFRGWIIGLGSGVKVIRPELVVQEMQQLAKRMAEQYLQNN